MRRLTPSLLTATLLLAACDRGEDRLPIDADPRQPQPGASASASAPTAPASVHAPEPSVSPEAPAGKLEVLKLRFAAKVEKKEPVGKLERAPAGERVYAHAVVRNRTGETRKIFLVFRVGDAVRSRVALDVVPSWSFRTWGYATLKPGDRGKLDVAVETEDGKALAEASLPIAGR